ncbi:hypothetical protein MXB_2775, partial [Myxobolus squamalis]
MIKDIKIRLKKTGINNKREESILWNEIKSNKDQHNILNNKFIHNIEDTSTYLESLNKYITIFNRYHGKNERSIEEAANLVGLRLPKI